MAKQDSRAKELLNTAFRLAQGCAAKIGDVEMRCPYLEYVSTHCETVQEFAQK